jgi:hypothetical protein
MSHKTAATVSHTIGTHATERAAASIFAAQDEQSMPVTRRFGRVCLRHVATFPSASRFVSISSCPILTSAAIPPPHPFGLAQHRLS